MLLFIPNYSLLFQTVVPTLFVVCNVSESGRTVFEYIRIIILLPPKYSHRCADRVEFMFAFLFVGDARGARSLSAALKEYVAWVSGILSGVWRVCLSLFLFFGWLFGARVYREYVCTSTYIAQAIQPATERKIGVARFFLTCFIFNTPRRMDFKKKKKKKEKRNV